MCKQKIRARPCCVCGVDMLPVARETWDGLQPNGGGEIRLIFAYGSRFDHLLEGTEFRGIICDDCGGKMLGRMFVLPESNYPAHGDLSQYMTREQWEAGE